MKGYKVFNPDWTCKNFKYKVGKTYEIKEKPKCCEIGFHFCKNLVDCFNYYSFNPKNKVAEIEAIGDIDFSEEDSKCSTNKILIVKQLSWFKVLELVNTGTGNTGIHNTGNYNSGNWNSGKYNSGDYNSGDCNSGTYNSGRYNSGNFNSGNYNSGDFNSGDRNLGSCNFGDWNLGNHNFGCFNTEGNQKIKIFNKDSDWTYYTWLFSSARNILNNIPKDIEKRQSWYDNLHLFNKESIKSLPNFDADIFFEITGIKV